MPRYQFPLQRLLDLRETDEDAARRQLLASEREVSVGRARLSDLHQEVAQTSQEAVPAPGQPVQPAQLYSNDLHLARLRMLAQAQQADVERLVSQEQADREQLVERARGRQVIERLKERGSLQHQAEWARREDQQLDEAGTMVFIRHRKNCAVRSGGTDADGDRAA
ncbi:MAG: flagellar export protein FliJ [Armatimonadota bacterium]